VFVILIPVSLRDFYFFHPVADPSRLHLTTPST
jgi:hypothetical protein